MSHLADQLRKLRGDKTLYQVQQDTGLPRITISRYERDENTPSVQNLKKLAHYYGIAYKDLRLLYYEDVLTDMEEKDIVMEWALVNLLPKNISLKPIQLNTLSEEQQLALVEAFESVLNTGTTVMSKSNAGYTTNGHS